MRHRSFLCSLAVLALCSAGAAAAAPPVGGSDIPQHFTVPTAAADYERREVMIPMRDGVRLHTVIVIPQGAHDAPILLTRTPYHADDRLKRSDSPHVTSVVPQADELFVADGYIRVFQDVRGKWGSQGDYVMTRPVVGPLNPTKVDHSTDAYDTIDWLVKNLPQSNGRVGMIGSSYEGFTVLMALINPHPALKAAVPESPMVDGWMGDDWFHYGAFRQPSFDYFTGQMSARADGTAIARQGYDDYQNFLDAGSAGDFARQAGLDQLPWWKRTAAHPAYDAFWQGQALDRILASQPLKVPTMYVVGAWDQEDSYGAPHAYAATEPKDTANDRNFLVIGPWRHSGVNYEGRSLGPLQFEGDTALQFRRDVLKPFLDQYLKTGAPKADTPPVFAYDTGAQTWLRLPSWPASCAGGCTAPSRRLYLQPGSRLAWTAPAAGAAEFDQYVSDPAKPVPYQQRPVRFSDSDAWHAWLLSDQRNASTRTDVLTYETQVLTAPVTIEGAPRVNLVASTSGTDSDWVVKVIDVYPDETPDQPQMGGYQLSVAMDIFRGRYRSSFEHPAPITPNQPLLYRFDLPNTAHTFLPGHRIMVQVQSSWFPLYDRNPQTYVDNIFFAKPGDYRPATQRVYHAPEQASFIDLPVAASSAPAR